MRFGNNWKNIGLMLVVGIVCLAFSATMIAQVQTDTTTTAGKGSKEVQVERGEVVLVQGNDLVVKMEDGSIRHFPNVPESARVTVDGKSLGIHDLKPGMKLQRTITTTSTPQTVKTVQTVTGKVWYVNPPNSVILTLENGQNQSFKIPKDQKFEVNGQMVDAFGLKKGMKVTATKITEAPETIVAQQKTVTGTMPTPPAPPPADTPILIVEESPTAAAAPPAVAAAPAPAPAETPAVPTETPTKTRSYTWLIGLVVVLLLAVWLATRSDRTKPRT